MQLRGYRCWEQLVVLACCHGGAREERSACAHCALSARTCCCVHHSSFVCVLARVMLRVARCFCVRLCSRWLGHAIRMTRYGRRGMRVDAVTMRRHAHANCMGGLVADICLCFSFACAGNIVIVHQQVPKAQDKIDTGHPVCSSWPPPFKGSRCVSAYYCLVSPQSHHPASVNLVSSSCWLFSSVNPCLPQCHPLPSRSPSSVNFVSSTCWLFSSVNLCIPQCHPTWFTWCCRAT